MKRHTTIGDYDGHGWEIRPNTDGTLDEVCARDIEYLHIEAMCEECFWIRLDFVNGTALTINLFGRKRKAQGHAFRHDFDQSGRKEPSDAP